MANEAARILKQPGSASKRPAATTGRASADPAKAKSSPAAKESQPTSSRASSQAEVRQSATVSNVSSLFEAAEKCMSRHDYDQVIQMLETVPENKRNDDVTQLLTTARQRSDEIQFLLAEIDEAERVNDNETLARKADELLKLKPGDHRAKKIKEKLSRHGVGLFSRRSRRTVDGRRVGEGSWIPWAAIAVGVIAIGLTSWAVYSYLHSGGSEIDPAAIAETEPDTDTDGSDQTEIASTIPSSSERDSPDGDGVWIDLFNGRDLTGWRYAYGKGSTHPTNETWVVDQSRGVLAEAGDNKNWIETDQVFNDFELVLDWRLLEQDLDRQEAGGVIVWSNGMHRQGRWADLDPTGVEIDLWRHGTGRRSFRMGTGCLITYGVSFDHEQGSFPDAAADNWQRNVGRLRDPAQRADGEWNSIRLVCEAGTLKVWINETLVNEVWNSDVASGRICIRGGKAPIEYRNIRVRELDGTSPVSPAEILISPDWEWTEPVNLGPVVNSGEQDGGPMISADRLTLLWSSTRPGTVRAMNLWSSTRNSTIDPFGAPVDLGPTVNTTATESAPALTSDGLTLYFASDRPRGEGEHDIWMARRDSLNGTFGAPVNLGPDVNSSAYDGNPAISNDGLTLLFNSQRPDENGKFRIWMSTRKSADDAFSEPVLLNLPSIENAVVTDPELSNDGLVLLFASDRAGGLGQVDLWMSVRSSPVGQFGQPIHLGPAVNSGGADRSPSLTTDGRTLYFASNRSGGEGKTDLWMSRRVPKDLAGTVDASVSNNRADWSRPITLDFSASVSADPLMLMYHTGDPPERDLVMRWRADQSSAWSAEIPLGALNTAGDEASPCFSADGLTLIFESDRPGGEGAGDLWIVTRRSSSDQWSAPVNLGPNVNSADAEGLAALSSDGRTIIFASGRTGGLGKSDLWTSQRSSPDANDWSPADNLGTAINSTDRELAPLLSTDGTELFFTSDRPGGQGSADLWVARRDTPGGPWSEPENLGPTVNSRGWDYGHVLANDDGLLLLTFNKGNRNESGFWMTIRD